MLLAPLQVTNFRLFALSVAEIKPLTVQKPSAVSPNVCNLPLKHPSECSGHVCVRRSGRQAKAFISASLIFALICRVAPSDSGYRLRRYFADMASAALVPLDVSDSLFGLFFHPSSSCSSIHPPTPSAGLQSRRQKSSASLQLLKYRFHRLQDGACRTASNGRDV